MKYFSQQTIEQAVVDETKRQIQNYVNAIIPSITQEQKTKLNTIAVSLQE
jgi:hypothetical protein